MRKKNKVKSSSDFAVNSTIVVSCVRTSTWHVVPGVNTRMWRSSRTWWTVCQEHLRLRGPVHRRMRYVTCLACLVLAAPFRNE